VEELLEPMPVSAGVWMPDSSDLAAARVAESALAAPSVELGQAFQKLTLECASTSADAGHMLALAADLVNATLDDDIAYRAASKGLLKTYSVDPVLEARLEESIADDPLELANARVLDSYEILWAHTFNSIMQPIGRSLITGMSMAPVALANSAVHYIAGFVGRDPLSLQGRQALALRKSFLREHPEAPESPKIARLVERDSSKLRRTFRNRRMRRANRRLAQGQPRAALMQAERALSQTPDDPDARDLAAQARAAIEGQRVLFARSLDASTAPLPELADPVARDVVELLLLPDTDLVAAGRKLRERHGSGPLSGEAKYLIALGLYEQGSEDASWRQLEALAAERPHDETMARHATAVVSNPWQDPYGAFKQRLHRGKRKKAAWRVLDNWAFGPRYSKLPTPVAYLVDSLSVAQTIVAFPVRLLFAPWSGGPNFQRNSAISAYHYLALHPKGEHTREVVVWLYEYERGRGNWVAAVRLADFHPDLDPRERAEVAEQAADQQLLYAVTIPMWDRRNALLRDVAREYPDATAGHQAGEQARIEMKRAAAQRIRMTRDFLKENPRIAGTPGLGLQAFLLDGDLENGELHPLGVTFVGGRTMEFALVDETSDEEKPPITLRRELSEQRLARLVALLDETSMTNTRIDRDELLEADARRDFYFERVRLGLTDEVDSRSAAKSTYVYQSVRERYGMVRGRDSILPFDLVFQGSLGDFSLGAFPRWRYPRDTPDAFMFR
jgi:hypothetical protein